MLYLKGKGKRELCLALSYRLGEPRGYMKNLFAALTALVVLLPTTSFAFPVANLTLAPSSSCGMSNSTTHWTRVKGKKVK